jgi:peptidase E
MQRSGLDELVRRRVLDEGAVYVGCSAGSIVAGATIQPAHWKGWDDPQAGGELAEVEWSEAACRSMRLVPDRAFFPHYDEREWAALVEERRDELGEKVEVMCLTDDGSSVYVSGEEGDEA